MANYKRPGIFISESLSSGQQIGTAPDEATGAFCEVAYRGPTDGPVLIESWADYIRVFGGFAGTATTLRYLPYAVWQYFVNGGGRCYVNRVIGSGSAIAAVTLHDRAATPQSTLTVSAKNAGIWGNLVYVEIVDRDATNGRFDILVHFGGATSAFVVERFTNVTMDTTDDRYVESVVNGLHAGSSYITVADTNSATVAPSDTPSLSTTVLTGGVDGASPSTGAYATAVSLLDQVADPIVLNLPGNSTQAIISSAISYCETRGNAFLVIDTAKALDPSSAVSYAAALTSSGYGAVYYPWQNVIDAASTLPGSTILLPPGGSVIAKYMTTDQLRGPFKAPAGYNTTIEGAVSNEIKLTDGDLDTLNTSCVNAIRQVSGAGIIVMGARTLKKTGTDSLVPLRRSLIFIKQGILNRTLFAIFEPNDANLWALMSDILSRFLTDYWTAGGLKGEQATDAFYVVCDATNNTQQTIEAGEVHADIGVSLQFPAEFVVINIAQWEGGSSAISV